MKTKKSMDFSSFSFKSTKSKKKDTTNYICETFLFTIFSTVKSLLIHNGSSNFLKPFLVACHYSCGLLMFHFLKKKSILKVYFIKYTYSK